MYQVIQRLRVVTRKFIEYIELKRSNDRLEQYNEWFESIDPKTMTSAELSELSDEKVRIVSLIVTGGDYDSIVKNRLRLVRLRTKVKYEC